VSNGDTLTITAIGTGYLGTTHAACMAELGFDVIGLDVDETRVKALASGAVPFYEPGLQALVEKHLESGRLRFTTSFAEAAEVGDVHFICVGTPQRVDSLAADLTHVDAAVHSLAEHLTRPALVVGKSTVPVGTATRLHRLLVDTAPVGEQVSLAWNPEFLREGHAVDDTLAPDRLVFGVQNEADERVLRRVYAQAIGSGTPVVTTDFATAELVKVAANAFLATKISFINAIAEICEVVDADVVALADAIGHDERIGRRFLNAGLGFGGGCLPKDIRAFMARAGEVGAPDALSFLREIDAINMRRRQRAVEVATEAAGGSVLGANVAVLGVAFKPDSDDVRDSPALNVAGQLQLQGARVQVYDPKAIENARHVFPTLSYAASVEQACRQADVVLHLTEWAEFAALDPAELRDVVRRPVIVDGRNCLDAQRWRDAGWTYRGLGRP
jgi:UDPglucose 6-dehydrogenase